ncbi:glycosyl hydrolase family 28-related protein [Aestuariimicrobium sp. Y1814]|uniref:glycosyl hydrolase family 28-related protein n=1 Tax=Aestuariimicrobium sp. Y1814 TaxID=3418742 RepID=UPI003DA73C47
MLADQNAADRDRNDPAEPPVPLVVSVRDCGARGDGVRDDADAIEAAAALAGAGGHVFFPKGVYQVGRGLTLPANQTWSGPTMNMDSNGPRTIIRGTGEGPVITCQAGTLQSLRIEGPGARVAGSVGLYVRASSFTLRDVSVRDVETGVSLLQVWYGHLDRLACYRVITGVRIEYSYNVVLANVRVAADDGHGTPGTAVELVDRSMVTLLGGAIEAYRVGVVVPDGASLACFGTYFETKLGAEAVGIKQTGGARSNVVASGCQVYLTHHHAWIDASEAGAGETVTATGNKFKGGVAGVTSHAYYWGGDTAVRMTMAGDSWADVVGSGPVYAPDEPLPPGSLLAPPHRPGAGGVVGQPAVQVSSNVVLTGQHMLATGSGRTRPATTDMPIGAMFFDQGLKRPVWWDGTTWRDAEGHASPPRQHGLSH